MDGDGRVAPTDGDGMSTREHWDECPSVFNLWWNVREELPEYTGTNACMMRVGGRRGKLCLGQFKAFKVLV